MNKRLSKYAYGDIHGKDYTPFTTDSELKKSEDSILVLVIGILLAVLFAASTTYSGLKTGITVAAGIPGAVIGGSILKSMKRDNILAPTLLQGMSSGGESVASGLIYILPAIILIGAKISFPVAVISGIAGALLGIAVASIVQQNVIVEEHGNLIFPEALAISETIVATEEGGEPLKFMLIGSTIGAIFTFISDSFTNVANKLIEIQSNGFYKWRVGLEVNPMLIGLGFIIGMAVAFEMLAGSILANFVVTPTMGYFTSMLPDTVVAWNDPTVAVNTMTASQIASTYTKYIGAGAMLCGGFISIIKLIPIIISSIQEQFKAKSSDEPKSILGKIVIFTGIIMALLTFVIASNGNVVMMVFAGLLTLAFVFMFAIVSARLAGSVGTSMLPVSGMTIASLVILTIVFVLLGATSVEDNKALLVFGTVIVTAISVSGGYSQSQKASFLIGGSPNTMLKGFSLSAIAGVVTVTLVILLCAQTENFATAFAMPQAGLMSALTQGILAGNLPWAMVLAGMALSIVIYMFGKSVMSVALGFYLSMDVVGILFIGGLLRYVVDNVIKDPEVKEKRVGNGISLSTGIVAGSSIVGILGIVVTLFVPAVRLDAPIGLLSTNVAALIQLIIALGLMYYFIVKYNPKKK